MSHGYKEGFSNIKVTWHTDPMLLDPLPHKSSPAIRIPWENGNDILLRSLSRNGPTVRREKHDEGEQRICAYLQSLSLVSIIPVVNKPYVPLFSAQLHLYYRQLLNFESHRDNKQLLRAFTAFTWK